VVARDGCIRAKELRYIVEQGRDPARENRGREIPPVDNIIQYIAEHLRTNLLAELTRADADKWGKIIKELNITPL
jgi:hypothetical protein